MRLDLFVACCTLSLTACGAGENRLDPGDLELRDVLGVAPEVATSWDAEQRTAARGVIEAGLHATDAAPMHAELAPGEQLAKALAAADAERAQRHAGALGVVSVAVDRGSVTATERHATLEPHANAPIAIEPTGWPKPLDAHELDVIAELATDAGHRAGPLIVTPAPRLAVAAGYVPATAGEPARLVVNPVVLAVLESPAVMQAGGGGGLAITPPPATATASAPGNPYSFYGSVAECAAAQKLRCDACLRDSSCKPIIAGGDGNAECTQFADQQGRGFSLACINLALAIGTVSSCTAGEAPGCPRDVHASESLATLENNAIFFDDATCKAPLDQCLGSLFGQWGGGSGYSPPPRDPSPSTGCGDSTCDPGTGCDAIDGSSCDGSSCDSSSDGGADSGCSSSDGSSGCDGSSCDDSGESSCDSSGGGSCDSGGDCGGGGDCSGGGGDCSGGGGDCNATARHGRSGGGTPIAILWALLPIPFARRVKRRAERKAREVAS